MFGSVNDFLFRGAASALAASDRIGSGDSQLKEIIDHGQIKSRAPE
jgi:hypothetical protein